MIVCVCVCASGFGSDMDDATLKCFIEFLANHPKRLRVWLERMEKKGREEKIDKNEKKKMIRTKM